MLDFKKQSGLIPAIIQNYKTMEVLMLAYMDEEALTKTLETGFTHFHSRSKKRLWKKGETSGNVQKVKKIMFDCDEDTLLIKVDTKGPACHTGKKSCFYRNFENQLIQKLFWIYKFLEENDLSDKSSTSKLLQEKDIETIKKRLHEELKELKKAVQGKHTHKGKTQKETIIMEGMQVWYWLCLFVISLEKNLIFLKQSPYFKDLLKLLKKGEVGLSGCLYKDYKEMREKKYLTDFWLKALKNL